MLILLVPPVAFLISSLIVPETLIVKEAVESVDVEVTLD